MGDLPENNMSCQSVSVASMGRRWVVTVIDVEGRSKREFAVENFARSFADGQRLRLGLIQAREGCDP